MAANFASKSNSKASGSHMEAMFAQAQKTQAALQEDYKNAPMTTPSKAGSKVPQARHGKASGLKPSYGSAAPKPKPRSNAISSEFEKKEYFDEEDVLSEKIQVLAQWIRESRYCIVFTGAGISTSTGIPDFRSGVNTVLTTGPGVWERKAHGIKLPSQQKKVQNVLKAVPSPSHMAIVKLVREGLVKFVVSQNTDGLHRRSGLDPKCLAELHGNTNMEHCLKCGSKFMRDYRTRTAKAVHDHLTGRTCDDPKCHGPLVDSIINFNEDLPEDELDSAFENAKLADLCIVLGSSLRVYPAADIPGDMIKRGAKVVIVNLQKTPFNKRCALEVHATIDIVLLKLLKEFGLDVPQFQLKRCFQVDVRNDSLLIQGLDPASKTPYSFLKQVKVEIPPLKKDIELMKEPFEVKFPRQVVLSKENPMPVSLTLSFQGHYGEPELRIEKNIEEVGPTMFLLTFDVTTVEWETEVLEE